VFSLVPLNGGLRAICPGPSTKLLDPHPGKPEWTIGHLKMNIQSFEDEAGVNRFNVQG